ncbi:MAG: ABC transporter ATP-binding protein, partial [Solobacterium sp.]|nr:ABC transporter ATP-binding protein [Solobacterium sp.]
LNTIVGADQIMVLGHGKIESIGTHKELIQNSSVYQKLWQSYSGKEVVE